MRAPRALVTALLLGLVSGLGPSPSAATLTSPRLTATITFDKNWRDP